MRFRAKYGQHDSSAAGQMRACGIGGLWGADAGFGKLGALWRFTFKGKKLHIWFYGRKFGQTR